MAPKKPTEIMLRLLAPHLRIESVLDLGAEQIRAMGLRALVLDVDCTLKSYCTSMCTPEIRAWVRELTNAGLGVCLVSNGCERRIGEFADELGVPYVAQAFKPMPFGVFKAMRRLGATRHETAMVGDQLFADVMAGRLARVFTVMVRPIQPEEEPWFTRLKRRPERILLRWMEPGSRLPSPVRSASCGLAPEPAQPLAGEVANVGS